MSKPQEFWLQPRNEHIDHDVIFNGPVGPAPGIDVIHVIEYSGYEELQDKIYHESRARAEVEHKLEVLRKERDEYRAALQNTVETIHDEFCGRESHHAFCALPRKTLVKYPKPGSGEQGDK